MNAEPTCPTGDACYSLPGCKDTACPGHPGPAKVARIKVSYQGPEPLPAQTWRSWLKSLALVALFNVGALIVCALAIPLFM
jgi:hypothetical protein